MICKFCGKQVAPSDRVCPYCGEPQEARTGGNGFWDILGREPVQAVPQTVVKQVAPSVRGDFDGKETKKKGVGSWVLLLVVILGIACTVILGVVELSTLGTLKKEMTAAVRKNETAIQALEEKMNLLTEKPKETQPSDPIVFLRGPQDTVLVNGTAAVSVKVAEELSPQKIQWEYKRDEAEWKPVAGEPDFLVTENGTTLQITVPEGQNPDAMCVRCYVQMPGERVYSHEAVITVPKG